MHISAMRMSWLIIFVFVQCGCYRKKSSSAVVSAISKREPVRLLISGSTILHTGLIFVHAKKMFNVASFICSACVAFVCVGNAHLVSSVKFEVLFSIIIIMGGSCTV